MKQIKYTIQITGISKQGKEIKINTHAASATELLKNLKDILHKDSKTWIEKLLGLAD